MHSIIYSIILSFSGINNSTQNELQQILIKPLASKLCFYNENSDYYLQKINKQNKSEFYFQYIISGQEVFDYTNYYFKEKKHTYEISGYIINKYEICRRN